MKLLADTHTHSLASTHAYSTIKENAAAAAAAGIEVLAITDHAPNIEDGAPRMHFMGYHVLPREMFGVKMLYGAELNILDFNGSLDLDESFYARMDICIASFHEFMIATGTKKENTHAMMSAMQNPCVAILGHPDDGNVPVDYEELVKEAKRSNVLLELNNSSLAAAFYRLNCRENMTTMLKLCEKHGAKVAVGTDAHVDSAVGNMGAISTLLDELSFPPELVVNTNPQKLLSHLASKGVYRK